MNTALNHEDHGTPLPVKTPINYKLKQKQLEGQQRSAMRKLYLVSFVSVFFITAQMIGGYIANSIAIFTDSAHLASDLIGFVISMISLKVAQIPATKTLSFGYHRAEIIGTLVSIIFIWGLTIWLVVEATSRIVNPEPIDGWTMFVVAVMGLIFNIIQMKILHSGDGHYHLGGGHDHHDHEHGHGHHHHSEKSLLHHHEHNHDNEHEHKHDHAHDHKKSHKKIKDSDTKEALLEKGDLHEKCHSDTEDQEKQHHKHHHHGHHEHHEHDHDHGHSHGSNINITSASLHVLGDMIMSIGVIIAATCIWLSNGAWVIADPICTYFFSIIVIVTTRPIFKECVLVMMEASPAADKIDTEKLEEDILQLPGVQDVHDFHLWSISVSKYAMSIHISSTSPLKTLSQVTDLCRRKYNLYHTTIQVEAIEGSKHFFECEQDLHD